MAGGLGRGETEAVLDLLEGLRLHLVSRARAAWPAGARPETERQFLCRSPALQGSTALGYEHLYSLPHLACYLQCARP